MRVLTSMTSPVQIVGEDDVVISSLFAHGARRIFCCAPGNLAVQYLRACGFLTYWIVHQVAQGDYLDGRIIAVGGTGSGSDPLQWIAEF